MHSVYLQKYEPLRLTEVEEEQEEVRISRALTHSGEVHVGGVVEKQDESWRNKGYYLKFSILFV